MKIILFLMALTVLADAAIFPSIRRLWNQRYADYPGCASLGESCSDRPCCPYYSSSVFNFGEQHCFQFGPKVCRRYKTIPNRREYFKLVNQLNSTNYQELNDRYWLSLIPPPPTPMSTRSPSRFLRFGR